MTNKFKMELTWHSCETYPPEEDYNPYLFVTDGCGVIIAEYRKDKGFFFDDKLVVADRLWWADIEQTVQNESKFKE